MMIRRMKVWIQSVRIVAFRPPTRVYAVPSCQRFFAKQDFQKPQPGLEGRDGPQLGHTHNTHRQQIYRRNSMHARQRIDRRAPPDNQHQRDQYVGDQPKHHEHHVRDRAVARANDLKKRVRVRRASLQLDGQGREQENLHSGPRGVPEGPRDAVPVAHARGLQEGGGPGPRGDDRGANEPGLDGSAGCVEHLRRLQLAVVAAQDEGHEYHSWAWLLVTLEVIWYLF